MKKKSSNTGVYFLTIACLFFVQNSFGKPSPSRSKTVVEHRSIDESQRSESGTGNQRDEKGHPPLRYSILGLKKTSPRQVRSFLWPHGQDKPLKDSDVSDLRNLVIFESVKRTDDRTIEVKEIWTTIPIVKFTSGGGVSSLTLGVFDPNIFGQLLEVGGQYGNLAGRNSFVVWTRKHRALGRSLLGADFWRSERIRFLYNEQGEQESAFIALRQRYHIFIENQLLPYLWIGGGLDYNTDSMSFDDLNQDFQNQFTNFFALDTLGQKRDKLWLRLFMRLGRLNQDIPFVEGQEFRLELRHANENLLSLANLFSISAQWRGFQKRGNHNWGGRLLWDFTTSDFPEDLLYVGGFDRVRGFLDGQFVGQDSLTANLEYRYRFFQIPSRWIELQAVAFSDLGHLNDKGLFFASVGGGLRVMSPRVYRLNMRFDVAQVLAGQPGPVFSFGLQQFF